MNISDLPQVVEISKRRDDVLFLLTKAASKYTTDLEFSLGSQSVRDQEALKLVKATLTGYYRTQLSVVERQLEALGVVCPVGPAINEGERS